MSCPYHANTTLVAQVSLEEVSQGGKIGPFTFVWTRLVTVSPHLREAWSEKKEQPVFCYRSVFSLGFLSQVGRCNKY